MQIIDNDILAKLLKEIEDDMVVLTNVSGQFLFFSKGFEKITGFTGDEVENCFDGFLRIVHYQDRELVENHYKIERNANKHEQHLIFRIITKSNEIKWLEHHCKPFYNHQNQFIGIKSIYRDITAQHETQQRLLLSEQKYRLLFEKMIAGYCLNKLIYNQNNKPHDWKYIEINSAFENIMSMPRNMVIGKSIKQLYPNVSQENIDMFCSVAVTGNTLEREFYARSTKKYYNLTAYKTDEHFFAIVFYDINEQVLQRKKEEQNQQRLEAQLELSKMNKAGLKELLDFVNDTSIRITQSKYGFIFYFSDEEQKLTLHTWNQSTLDEFLKTDKTTEFIRDINSILDTVLHDKKTLVNNDFKPSNHVKHELKTYIGIPVFDDEDIVAVLILVNKPTDYTTDDVNQIQLLSNSAWSIIQKHQTERELEKYQKHLEEVIEQRTQRLVRIQQENITAIIKGEENERSRLAQELHDGLGPLMTTLKLYMQTLQRLNDINAIHNIAQNAEETFRETLQTITEVSNNISPHILKNFGLLSGIKSFVDKKLAITKINFKLDCKFTDRIDTLYEITLYRVIIELINNSIKHSEADSISLKIFKRNDYLFIKYTDNGKGFDIDNVNSKSKGMGLFNIQNRIRHIRGNVRFGKLEKAGFVVKIIVKTN